MRCPYCSLLIDKVVDSRLSRDGLVIRRRRECFHCNHRFTTYERIEEIPFMVVKKDGRREPFDRQKIMAGVRKACEKRPVGMEALEELLERVERQLQNKLEKEVPSSEIGELVMRELHDLDEVAYVRFASVYRQFRDITDFMSEVKGMLK